MSSPVFILLSGTGLAVIRLLAGLVRSKWIAHAFGPAGVGLIAQAQQFQMICGAAASFSTGAAIIQAAKGPYRARSDEVFRCALFLILTGSSTILLALAAVGFDRMGNWLFGPGFGAADFLAVLLALPFALLSSCFLECAFFTRDRFDRYTVTSALHALLQSGAFVLLSWLYGMRGLLVAVPVSAFILFAFFCGDLLRIGELRWRWFLPRWNGEIARFLLSHGAVMFATGVGGSFLLLFARTELIKRTGLDSNGVLQVPVALSAYGSAIMTNFLWGRVHPLFSAGGSHGTFELSFCTITSFLVALGTWVLGPVIVPAIYSKDFLVAVPLIGLQCVGDVFHYSFLAVAVAMLASGHFRTYLAGWTCYYAPYVLLLVLPGNLQPHAFVSLHLIGSLLAFLMVSARSLHAGPFPGKQAIRLVALTCGLGALGGIAVRFTPAQLVFQGVVALAAAGLGLVLWRFFYGELVNEQVRQAKGWMKRKLRWGGA